jgi:hypothetical protein
MKPVPSSQAIFAANNYAKKSSSNPHHRGSENINASWNTSHGYIDIYSTQLSRFQETVCLALMQYAMLSKALDDQTYVGRREKWQHLTYKERW